MAGVTEELSILSGSALPAGLSAVLREGNMAKVVFAGSARSPSAPQALGLRVEAADASPASPRQSSEACPAAVEDRAGLVWGAGTSVSQRGTTRSPNSSPLEPGGESQSRRGQCSSGVGRHLPADRCPWVREDARQEEQRAQPRHLSAPSGEVPTAPNLPFLASWR